MDKENSASWSGHGSIRRETTGTIVDNYEFGGSLDWQGRDLHYGDDGVWICECGKEFESKEAVLGHLKNNGVPKKSLPTDREQ